MASEAPVAHQKVDELVEDVKGTDEVKDAVEKVEVEDLTTQETNAAEPQELQEERSDALAAEVNKEELKDESTNAEPSLKSEEKEGITTTYPRSDTPEPSIEAHTAETEEDEKHADTLSKEEENKEEPKDEKPDIEPSVEAEQKEISTSSDQPDTLEQLIEVDTVVPEEEREEKQDVAVGTGANIEAAKDESQDVETLVESDQKEISTVNDLSDTPEPSNEATEVPAEVEETVVQEAEPETAKESAVSETVGGEFEIAGEVRQTLDATVDTTIEKISHEAQVSTVPSEEVPPSNGTTETIIEDEKVQENAETESSVSVGPTESNESKQAEVISEVPAEDEKPSDDTSGNKDTEKEENVSAADEVQTLDTVPVTQAEDIQVSNETSFNKAEDNIESDINIVQEKPENSAEVEKTTVPEPAETVSTNEVGEVPEDVKPSGTVEVVTDENNRILEGETPQVAETTRDIDLGGVESKVEQFTEESEFDGSGEKIVAKEAESRETLLDKFVKEGSEAKKREETENFEKEDLTETKDTDGDTETQEIPKEEIPAKPPTRHSNNILSKMKQSLVKVKKAITGKSPNSKSIASEGKDNAKEK